MENVLFSLESSFFVLEKERGEQYLKNELLSGESKSLLSIMLAYQETTGQILGDDFLIDKYINGKSVAIISEELIIEGYILPCIYHTEDGEVLNIDYVASEYPQN